MMHKRFVFTVAVLVSALAVSLAGRAVAVTITIELPANNSMFKVGEQATFRAVLSNFGDHHTNGCVVRHQYGRMVAGVGDDRRAPSCPHTGHAAVPCHGRQPSSGWRRPTKGRNAAQQVRLARSRLT